MTLFKSFKHKKIDTANAAVAFVDYEYWFYSYEKLYGIKPDLQQWQEDISAQYNDLTVYFFADFTNTKLRSEVPRIREITNHIIETQNTGYIVKKDITDFIILDYIYQAALGAESPDNFIIFTGDAHFQSAVKFLRYKCKKNVLVFGVKLSFSKQLKAVASEFIEMPTIPLEKKRYYKLIISHFDYIAKHPEKDISTTFKNTVRIVASRNNLPEEHIEIALSEMCDKNYLYKTPKRLDFNTNIKVLAVNWDILIQEGLYKPH